jgi:hypothetical protein
MKFSASGHSPQPNAKRRDMAENVKGWFDEEADYLEVRFADAPGYMQATSQAEGGVRELLSSDDGGSKAVSLRLDRLQWSSAQDRRLRKEQFLIDDSIGSLKRSSRGMGWDQSD